MNIYFNEKCLEDYSDVNSAMRYLFSHLSVLYKEKIFTRFTELHKWQKYWDSYLDKPSRDYFIKIVEQLYDCPTTQLQCYYHLFQHQDYGLTVSGNLYPASLVFATEEILEGHITVILNLPDTIYSKRDYIPVIRSSHNTNQKDELINIRGFTDAFKIKQYILLHEKIKKHLSKEKFEHFSHKCDKFWTSFDRVNWQPHQKGSDGKLNTQFSFPAASEDIIKEELSLWEIEKSSPGENIAEYKRLGGMVLEIHGYVKNDKLTGHYGYNIYEAGYGRDKLLISLDVENGNFEVLDYSGTHVGTYNYIGEHIKTYTNQTEINLHSLQDLPRNLLLF